MNPTEQRNPKRRHTVERGADLLDEKRPGWERQIDPDTLDLSTCEHCVLGQVFGDYVDGLPEVGVTDSEAPAYGFKTWGGQSWTNSERTAYYRLTARWLRLLQTRYGL